MTANKIVWKRVRAQKFSPGYLRGYTGQWCSFLIRANICDNGFNMHCMLPDAPDCPCIAKSEKILTEAAQGIFDKWFEGLMKVKE